MGPGGVKLVKMFSDKMRWQRVRKVISQAQKSGVHVDGSDAVQNAAIGDIMMNTARAVTDMRQPPFPQEPVASVQEPVASPGSRAPPAAEPLAMSPARSKHT